MQRLFSIGLIALALGIAAATLGARASAASSPCSLLTQNEAAHAMGTASLPGKFESGVNTVACRYYSSDHTKNVYIQMQSAAVVNQAPRMGGKLVPGVGDKAYWFGGTIFLQSHANYVSVALYLSSQSMNRMDPAIVPLAKLVASRL